MDPENSGADETRLSAAIERIDATFRARVGVTAPSTAFAIARKGHQLHCGTYGGAVLDDQESGIRGCPPEPNTAYRIASCTKSFVAAVILMLRDRRQLTLDDEVRQYIPELNLQWRGEYGFAATQERITIRNLLTMSGGFPTDNPWGDRQESITKADFLTLIQAGIPLAHCPGLKFEYSNLGYALLGLVIERVSGRDFIEYVSGNILATLSLDCTSFDADTLDLWHEGDVYIATGYSKFEHGWVSEPFTSPGMFSPIGGLFSGTEDVTSWVSYLMEAFDPAAAERGPLSKASRREMQSTHQLAPHQPVHARPMTGYGFGLVTLDDPSLGLMVMHAGGYPGFSAHMAWHPATGLSVVGFENATNAKVPLAVIDALFDVVRADVGASEIEVSNPPPRLILLHSPPWPETLAAATAFDAAVQAGDLSQCKHLVSANFELDQSFQSRNAALAALTSSGTSSDKSSTRAQVDAHPDGAYDSAAVPRPLTERLLSVHSASAASWLVSLGGQQFICALTLTPTLPPQVQEFHLTVKA